jgi:uncharacterized protein (DUF302 family)
MTPEGLTCVATDRAPRETADALAAAIAEHGLTLFARVDHAAGAAAVGMELRPTELLIFGNAKGGTPLMQEVQTVGIDLPLKLLVFQDAAGKTWIAYNQPEWIAARHGVTGAAGPIAAMSALLATLARKASEPAGQGAQ